MTFIFWWSLRFQIRIRILSVFAFSVIFLLSWHLVSFVVYELISTLSAVFISRNDLTVLGKEQRRCNKLSTVVETLAKEIHWVKFERKEIHFVGHRKRVILLKGQSD